MRGLMRSGMFTPLLLIALLLALSVAYVEHLHGNLHRLKQRIGNQRPETPSFQPGGQEPIVLTRSRLMGDSSPEFTSVTLLPGRGMNVLQITAFVPGKGEIDLLDSRSIEDATSAMNGTGADAGGAVSLSMGGAFEAPWADRIASSTMWRGRQIAEASREGGWLLAAASTATDVTALPDGGHADATFDLAKSGSRWPSKTQIKISVLLSSKYIDLTMTARNVGDTAEPIGLGWRPRFAVAGDRSQMRLRLPAEMRIVMGEGSAPVGATVPVAGTPYDFRARPGTSLGDRSLDETFTGFRQDLLESGPVTELSFPTEDYGVRLTALTPAIKAMRVIMPAKGGYAVVAPRFNYPDPFGREWSKADDAGMVTLQPGESTEWKVRLEIFTPGYTTGAR